MCNLLALQRQEILSLKFLSRFHLHIVAFHLLMENPLINPKTTKYLIVMLLTLGTGYRVFYRRTSIQVNSWVASYTVCSASPEFWQFCPTKKRSRNEASRQKEKYLSSDKLALSARFSLFRLTTRDNIIDGLFWGHAPRTSLDSGPPREATTRHVIISVQSVQTDIGPNRNYYS